MPFGITYLYLEQGWLRAFAVSYIAFLYTPLAMEKVVYFFIARWIAKRILKIRKRMNLEPRWQKAYKNISLFCMIKINR